MRTGKKLTMVAAAVSAALALGTSGASAAPAHTDTVAHGVAAQQNGNAGTASAAASQPTLARGSSGTWVKRWQRSLNAYMHTAYICRPTLTVDGDFGNKTYNATTCFQSVENVAGGADGIVGPNTWDAMCDYLYWAPGDEAFWAWYEACA